MSPRGNPKRRTSFALSVEAKQLLFMMASIKGISMASVLEEAIREKAARDARREGRG